MLSVAFQMDPIEAVDIDADSSFRLAEAAQARGHRLFYYTPDKLIWEDNVLSAVGQDMTLRRVRGDHASLGRPDARRCLNSTSCGCAKTRPLTWDTLPQPIFWTWRIAARWL